jgi:glutathione-independent formaldehyde dehydrogenase
MSSNRGVAYIKPETVQVESIDFPKFVDPSTSKPIEHGVILKVPHESILISRACGDSL